MSLQPAGGTRGQQGPKVCRKVPTLAAPVLLTPLSLPLNSEPFSSPSDSDRVLVTMACPSLSPEHTSTFGGLHSHLEVSLPLPHLTCPHAVTP